MQLILSTDFFKKSQILFVGARFSYLFIILDSDVLKIVLISRVSYFVNIRKTERSTQRLRHSAGLLLKV